MTRSATDWQHLADRADTARRHAEGAANLINLTRDLDDPYRHDYMMGLYAAKRAEADAHACATRYYTVVAADAARAERSQVAS